MPRARYQADGNQAEIIAALRAAGCTVSVIGGANGNTGVPDLLVGRSEYMAGGLAMRNYLLEVKAPGVDLNDAQKLWHATWGGQVAVVRTVEQALTVVGLRP